MAISSYTGLPGAGKSYEVIRNVLIPNYAQGRRIVTNIDGVNVEEIEAYLEQTKGVKGVCDCGEIVKCTDSDILNDNFYPISQDDSWSFVKPGDLVIIDEAQNFYRANQKISDRECKFFREHRHFCDEQGRGCDVVLLSQRFADIHRFIRDVIELIFLMRQLKVVGMPSRYTVSVYDERGTKLSGPKIFKYKSEVFKCYKSFAVTGGMQAQVDKRQNAITPFRVFIAIALFLFVIFAFKSLFGFFSVPEKPKPTKAPKAIVEEIKKETEVFKGTTPLKRQVRELENYSQDWRILGVFSLNGKRQVAIQNQSDEIRFYHPQNFKGQGSFMQGEVNGKKITYFTGKEVQEENKKGSFNL